jgi:hypothetical protein
MELTDVEMDVLVPAWERRLFQIHEACLAEVKSAMKPPSYPGSRAS